MLVGSFYIIELKRSLPLVFVGNSKLAGPSRPPRVLLDLVLEGTPSCWAYINEYNPSSERKS